jgi:UDP-glucose 4-epimerase
MKKACVFGGSGFLGSHIADHLNSAGYEVIVFDTKPSKWLNSRQKMIIGSILEYKQVEKAISGSEIVYNCAALSDLEECLYKPLEVAKINILGNCKVIINRFRLNYIYIISMFKLSIYIIIIIKIIRSIWNLLYISNMIIDVCIKTLTHHHSIIFIINIYIIVV